MSKMIIFRPIKPTSVVATAGMFASTAGLGEGNLLTPEPKEVYDDNGGGGVKYLSFDLGAVHQLDCFLLGFIRGGSPGIFFSVAGGIAAHAEFALTGVFGLAQSSSAAPKRRHAFVQIAAPIAARYVRIELNANDVNFNTIGIAAFGRAIKTTHNREKGGGRSIIDTGSKESRQDGGFGIGHGTRKAGFRWTWGDLSDDEIEAIYDLGLEVGETNPIVVVEDPDPTTGLNERIHYGLFDRFEVYERGDPEKHRWALSVTQWV